MKNKIEVPIFRLYVFAAAVTLGIFLTSLITDPTVKENDFTDFSGSWYADEDMTVPGNPTEPAGSDNDRFSRYYSVVPDYVTNGQCLSFRTKNCTVSVYMDGKEVYRVKPADEFYGKSPGTQWVRIPLGTDDAGKALRIEINRDYDDSSCYLDDMYIGSADNIVLDSLAQRTVGFVTCILLIFTGAVLIIVHLAMNRSASVVYTQELMYLGCFAIATACWSLCETKLFQIFSVNSGAVHNLSCMSLMLIILPLFMFFSRDTDSKSKWVVNAVTFISISDFVICVMLHFMKIADFHETLMITHIVIGISAISVVYANYLRCFKNKNRKTSDIVAGVGMVIFAVSAVIDVIRYRSGSVEDSSMFTRIGLLIYVIILGICSLSYIAEMVKKGMTSDLISRLAYEDGLTGLGNRTAYSERLEAIDGKPAAIFVFDINNLKYVNDNLGHQAGDELIKAGAELIFSVFGKYGNCYRIGGDEFVCLAEETADIEKLTEQFYAEQKSINEEGELGFPLVVAMGAEIYDGKDNIRSAINSADHKMYIKKSELKEQKV